jgi:hypothetical protein
MDKEAIPVRITATRFVRSVRNFAASDAGGKAKAIFVILTTLLVAATELNVVNIYVGRNFMTAIAYRDRADFIHQAVFYVGVFAAGRPMSASATTIYSRISWTPSWNVTPTGNGRGPRSPSRPRPALHRKPRSDASKAAKSGHLPPVSRFFSAS